MWSVLGMRLSAQFPSLCPNFPRETSLFKLRTYMHWNGTFPGGTTGGCAPVQLASVHTCIMSHKVTLPREIDNMPFTSVSYNQRVAWVWHTVLGLLNTLQRYRISDYYPSLLRDLWPPNLLQWRFFSCFVTLPFWIQVHQIHKSSIYQSQVNPTVVSLLRSRDSFYAIFGSSIFFGERVSNFSSN